MFYRANPGMTSLPCSCKEIYERNATEELHHEDKCHDLYGRRLYSNILYKTKQPTSKVVEVSKIFSQLRLNPSSQTTIHEFQEISPWRACGTLRDPHKTCVLNSENFASSENPKTSERDQIQRRSLSTSEATANQRKNTKSENSYEASRPYSDSKLDYNSRKPNCALLNSSRFVPGKGAFDDGYKFYHFKDFWKYMKEYMNNVTIVRLQQQYRNEISRRHGDQKAKSERQGHSERPGERALKAARDQEKSMGTRLGCDQASCTNVPATNHAGTDCKKISRESRDKSCDQTCYSFKFPSFETCSFKVARCRVHTESRRERKPRPHKDQDSSVINRKIQMLCQRLSNANCNIKEDRKVRRPRSTKILQKSKTRKLEIVTRPSNKSPRKKPSLRTKLRAPPYWQDYCSVTKRFPSPRIVCKSPLIGKQVNFQGKIIAKKYLTKASKEYPVPKKVFLEYGSKAVHGKI